MPDSAQITNGSGEVNDFFLAPNGNDPIALTATGQKGSGATAEVVPFATFTWQAAFAPAGTKYLKGASPNGSTTCGTPPETPAVPILQAGTAGPAFSLYGGQFSYLTPGHTATTVYIGTPLDPTTHAPVQPAANSSYCLIVQAINANNAIVGSTIVVVTNTAT